MVRVSIWEAMVLLKWTTALFITIAERPRAVACSSQALLRPCHLLNFQRIMLSRVVGLTYPMVLSLCQPIHMIATLDPLVSICMWEAALHLLLITVAKGAHIITEVVFCRVQDAQ